MIFSDKHSAFSSTFPVYLFTQRTEEVPVEEDELPKETETVPEREKEDKTIESDDDDEVLIEDVPIEEEKKPQVPEVPKTKTVTIDEWVHANSQPPIWTRYALGSSFRSPPLLMYPQRSQGCH